MYIAQRTYVPQYLIKEANCTLMFTLCFRNTKDDTIPLSRPVLSADGSTWLSTLPLQKNTTLFIALEAANRDPGLWGPDASEWRPARWLSPLPKAAEGGLPSVYSHLCVSIIASSPLLILLKNYIQSVTFFAGNRSCMFVVPFFFTSYFFSE